MQVCQVQPYNWSTHTADTCKVQVHMLCCRHVNHFTSIAAIVHTNRHHGCDRPPAIITKVLVLSVSTKQILSMVDAVKCPICLYMLHQPIELPCHAYVCSSCLKEWIRVTVGLKCPCCYSVTSLQPAELIQPPELIIRLLGEIMVHCTSSGTDVMA